MSSPDPAAPAPRPVLTQKQAQRARQPVVAMVLSVLAVLAAVLVMLALNPEPASPVGGDRVDVAAAAATVPDDGGLPALAPQVPEAWDSTYARLSTLEGVPTWEIGWAADDTVFAGLRQAQDVDPTWLTLRVGTAPAVGTVEVDGLAWKHFAPRDSDEEHFVAEMDGSTVVLTSTGGRPALEDLAHAVAKEIR